MYYAKFSGPDQYEDDPNKLGFVWVEFDGEHRRAFPYNPVFQLQVPTLEFIEKYRDSLWCLVDTDMEPESGDMEEYLLWTGVAPMSDWDVDDDQFDRFIEEYPYFRMPFFSENWTMGFSDKEGENHFVLIHSDGTKIEIDREDPVIRLSDAETGHSITMEDGKISIEADGDVEIGVPSGSKVNVGGPGGQALATKQFVSSIFNQHIHAGSMGPTGPPQPLAPMTPGGDITRKTEAE